MEITGSTMDRDLPDTEAARVAWIREQVGLARLEKGESAFAHYLENHDIHFLLQILDRHKANALAAQDRVCEVEKERGRSATAQADMYTELKQACAAIGQLRMEQEQRQADVRELVEAIQKHGYFDPETRVGQAMEKVGRWGK